MSQTSSTPGHVQSRDARQHQSPLEEIQRLKEALKETQDEIEFLKEELAKARAEKRTLWIENRRLRGPGHGTSGDQTSIQQWQDRAEKAERRAEEAEGKLLKMRDVEFPDLMHSMLRTMTRIFANKMREIDDDPRLRLQNRNKIPSHSKQPPPRQSGSDTITSDPKMGSVEGVQRRSTTEKDTSAGSKETAALHSVRSKGDSTGPKQETQSDLLPLVSRHNTLPRVPLLPLPLPMLGASPKGPASRMLDRPSSQQQSSSRQVRPKNLSNADCQSRFPHETTSAVKERVLTLGEPSDLREDYIPGWDPDPSPLPEISAASTASAILEAPQPETKSFRGYWPGAEPAEVQSAVRDHDVHSLSAGTTGDSTQDDEQTPDAISTPVAAGKRSKGIPTATSRTRGKYWPRGRIE